MAKKKAKAKAKTIGAFGEDLETNQPVQPLPLAPGPIESPVAHPLTVDSWSGIDPLAETSPKPKDQPKTWPFSKSNVINEKKEMEHVLRLVNMKNDNPGVVKITKVVVYDCLSRQCKCKDYKIEYKE